MTFIFFSYLCKFLANFYIAFFSLNHIFWTMLYSNILAILLYLKSFISKRHEIHIVANECPHYTPKSMPITNISQNWRKSWFNLPLTLKSIELLPYLYSLLSEAKTPFKKINIYTIITSIHSSFITLVIQPHIVWRLRKGSEVVHPRWYP